MRRLLPILTLALLAGCAPQSKYAWGGYDSSLYDYYKTPAQAESFTASLQDTIASADANAQRVGPGIHAEYGYMLMLQGKKTEAVASYEREKKAWPESTRFMDLMIANAKGEKPKTDTTADAKTGVAADAKVGTVGAAK